ncbi:MAG: outer membrane beta-barrel protein [Alcanivorax sp.]|nr:outer membrane beta-barrel protein [Alcanivorax sp.]
MIRKIVTAALFAVPLTATAGGFAGLDYVSSSIEPDHGGKGTPSALQFKFGSWINRDQTLGGELRLGLGVGDDRLKSGVDVEIDRYYGAYFRGQFPNTLPVRPYGLIGLTRVETTETYSGGSRGENYNDISLGLGADITITPQVFVSVEYLRVVDHSGDQISNLAVGVNGRF